MSRLSEFQIYAMIKRLEVSLKQHERAGDKIAAKRTRKKLGEYQAELGARIEHLVQTGGRMPDVFAEVR